MRMFVAIDAPDAVKEQLGTLIRNLRDGGVEAAWTLPQNMHLTLRFLGDVPDDMCEALVPMLENACANFEPVQLRVAGVGAFPSLGKPAVLWAGVVVESGDLAGLQAAIEHVAQDCGLPPESKPFRPHLTLARIRNPRQGAILRPLVESAADFKAGAFTAGRVALCSSKLARGGAIHTRIREFPLVCLKQE